MAKKTTTKRKDTTPKHVKNTQTEVEPNAGPVLRWYHIAATVVVFILVVIAVVKILTQFDLSLISSKYTLKHTYGCTTSITGQVDEGSRHYRYAGASNGMMLGKNGLTSNEDEAWIKIVELGNGNVHTEVRNYQTNEWEENKVVYGTEQVVTVEQAPDCMPGITYIINN